MVKMMGVKNEAFGWVVLEGIVKVITKLAEVPKQADEEEIWH
jgi:hypothetical protein